MRQVIMHPYRRVGGDLVLARPFALLFAPPVSSLLVASVAVPMLGLGRHSPLDCEGGKCLRNPENPYETSRFPSDGTRFPFQGMC